MPMTAALMVATLAGSVQASLSSSDVFTVGLKRCCFYIL